MSKIDLNTVLAQADQLPAVSKSAIELVSLLANDDVDIHTLADKVTLDPVISSRVLKVANSTFFNRGRQVGSIPDAVMIIGMINARSLIIAAAVMSKSKVPDVPGFSLDYFWRHSLSTAVVTQQLALHLGLSTGMAFSAGLLHDIGKLILALAWPESYAKVIKLRNDENMQTFEAELEVFGIDHSTVAAGILGDWNLPATLVNAINEHHMENTSSDLLASSLRLANVTASYAMNTDEYIMQHDEFATQPVDNLVLEEMMPDIRKQYQRYSVLF